MDFKEFGYFVKKIRKEKGISQRELCEDVQISRATLSAFENGKGEVGFRKVLQVIDYLDFELSPREKSLFPTLEDLQNE
ncbi:MAG: transcriptional regulator [Proteobacteria bacterium]|nr:MAG: transcriptional regulator [Pseudomonadota bacterium]